MKKGVAALILGVTLFLLGILIIPLFFILPLRSLDPAGAQFKAPGSIEIAIEEPGRYYLWNDYRTVFLGKTYNLPENIPHGLEIRILCPDAGPLEFVSDTSISTSSGRSSKNSIGYVEIGSGGVFRIEVIGNIEERIFSFHRANFLRIFGLILRGLGIAALLGIAGAGAIIWGIVILARNNGKGGQIAPPGGAERER